MDEILIASVAICTVVAAVCTLVNEIPDHEANTHRINKKKET